MEAVADANEGVTAPPATTDATDPAAGEATKTTTTEAAAKEEDTKAETPTTDATPPLPPTLDNDTSSTDDDDDDDDSDLDAPTSPTEDPVEVLIKATTHKEEGNAFFKAGTLDKAVRSYRKGTNLLKPLNKGNTGDDQVKALLVTLQNNLSMVFFKQSKHKVSRDVATKSLQIDPNNVKALYRRACAHKKLGDLEQARDDLKVALALDGSNTAVKKELAQIKKALVDYKAQQKKALSQAFGGGVDLYQDKELEKKQKEEEERLKKEKAAKAKEERKKQWEDECVKRMAKGDEAISFDDWEKEREAEEKRRKKEQAAKEKEERKARQAAQKAAQQQKAKNDSSDDEDEELTEAELASLRGYKKTADGRVTSYFTREQSQQEKQLIGNIAPQRLEASSTPTLLSTSSGESGNNHNTQHDKKKRPSAWNQAGTWEEKDTTKWCSDKLSERLLQANGHFEECYGMISKVENLTGEASVAITNGKKRYIFDYHVQLKFEIRNADDADEVVADGTLNIPDICSTSHDELEINFTGWKNPPSSATQNSVVQCQQVLLTEIRNCVQQWVEDFNHHY